MAGFAPSGGSEISATGREAISQIDNGAAPPTHNLIPVRDVVAGAACAIRPEAPKIKSSRVVPAGAKISKGCSPAVSGKAFHVGPLPFRGDIGVVWLHHQIRELSWVATAVNLEPLQVVSSLLDEEAGVTGSVIVAGRVHAISDDQKYDQRDPRNDPK